MSYYRLRSKEIRKRCDVTSIGKLNSRSKPVSPNESSPSSRSASAHRHTRESGYPEVFEFLGFRVALAIASLPGMTPILFNEFWERRLAVLILRARESLDAIVGDIKTQARHLCEIFPVHVDFHSIPIRDVVHLMNIVVRWQ